MTSLQRFAPAIGRIFMATLFLMGGIGKLAAPAATKAYIASAGLPLPDIAYLIAVFVELGFGIALLVGFQTRFVAAVLALFTLATAVGFHSNFADQNQMIHFLKNIAIMGGFLQIVAFGPGAFSLDDYLHRPRSSHGQVMTA